MTMPRRLLPKFFLLARPHIFILACASSLAASLVAPCSNAHAEGISLSAGSDYSSGKYGGTQTTEVWYFPVVAKYIHNDWTMQLTVPYLSITGPNNILGTPGQTIVLPPTTLPGAPSTFTIPATSRTESGLGDVVAGATWNALYNPSAIYGLDLTSKIKFATADETRGLGTGKNDYSLQADMFKGFTQASVFGSLGYRVMGKPTNIKLNNVWFGSVGSAYRFSARTSAGVAWDMRQASSTSGAASRELSAFISYKLLPKSKIQLYTLKGWADGSPDFGGGVNYSHGF